jgi:hypothetical protein
MNADNKEKEQVQRPVKLDFRGFKVLPVRGGEAAAKNLRSSASICG